MDSPHGHLKKSKKTQQKQKTQTNNQKTQQKKKLLLIYRYLSSDIEITEQITLFSSRTEKELRETEENRSFLQLS